MSEQMKASVRCVETGITLSNQASEAISNINDRSRSALGVIANVSEAIKEQSTASQDIAARVENIVAMIEENTRSVSSVAVTAEELDGLSRDLKDDISRFKMA